MKRVSIKPLHSTLYITLCLLFVIFTAVFGLSGCGASDGGNESGEGNNEVNDGNIVMLADELGITSSEAAKIVDLLNDSGFETKIEYITRWNDAETNEAYYRIRSGTESRDLYLYSDGEYKLTNGDTAYYSGNIKPSDESAATNEQTLPQTQTITDDNYNDVTTPDTTDIITDDIITDTVTDTEPDETDAETKQPEEIDETDRTDEATVIETETETETAQIEVILNTNSKKYHYPGCSSISRMKEENKKAVTVSSVEELFDMGYDPCGICAKADKSKQQ